MNLVNDPWIPVIYKDQNNKLVSLDTLFKEAEEIGDLVATPPQRIALMRLLICITQAALDGPEDEENWFYCNDKMIPEALAYLSEWEDRFDLYGDRAFLQAQGLSEKNNSTCDKLDFRLASGNNQKLMDHQANPDGREWPDAWLALMLMTYQCFSPCGIIGGNEWCGYKTSTTSVHSPAIVESALHTLVRGENLLASIHSNLLTKEQILAVPNMKWGKPSWTITIDSLEIIKNGDQVNTYLGRLVPLSRAIKLKENSLFFTLANGLSYPKIPEGRETTASVIMKRRNNNEEEGYVSIDLNKHAWRQLGSLLSINRDSVVGGAIALQHLQHIKKKKLDIWTGGLAASGNGKILDAVEWLFQLDTKLLEDRILEQYKSGVNLAQTGQYLLSNAVSDYCKNMKMNNVLSLKARNCFWSTLDSKYNVLIDNANSEDTKNEKWYKVIRNTMIEAYKFACPHTTPRQIQAFSIGRRRLNLKKPQE
ncbi:type I-E CRISPR-associated protein Cse1/CasA [bacterium]|nr:type I-E CRISPR-associated protein Cse1/CasA [bacterium]